MSRVVVIMSLYSANYTEVAGISFFFLSLCFVSAHTVFTVLYYVAFMAVNLPLNLI